MKMLKKLLVAAMLMLLGNMYVCQAQQEQEQILEAKENFIVPEDSQNPDEIRTANLLNNLLEHVRDNDITQAQRAINDLVATQANGQHDVSKLNTKDRFGRSILEYMAMYGRKSLMDYLLDQESSNSKIELEGAQKLVEEKIEELKRLNKKVDLTLFEMNALLQGGKKPQPRFQATTINPDDVENH